MSGDASAIIFSSPLPAMILCWLVLGESLRLYKVVCGVLLYLGLTCVVRPTFLFRDSHQEM